MGEECNSGEIDMALMKKEKLRRGTRKRVAAPLGCKKPSAKKHCMPLGKRRRSERHAEGNVTGECRSSGDAGNGQKMGPLHQLAFLASGAFEAVGTKRSKRHTSNPNQCNKMPSLPSFMELSGTTIGTNTKDSLAKHNHKNVTEAAPNSSTDWQDSAEELDDAQSEVVTSRIHRVYSNTCEQLRNYILAHTKAM